MGRDLHQTQNQKDTTLMSPTHLEFSIFAFTEQEVTIFGQVGGARE